MTEQPQTTRREFIHKAGVLIGAGIMVNLYRDIHSLKKKTWTVGEIIDSFLSQVPMRPLPKRWTLSKSDPETR